MQNEPELKDAFSKRRKRPKGWLAKAIKDGSVRDPKLGPNPQEEHAEDAVLVEAPVMTIKQKES